MKYLAFVLLLISLNVMSNDIKDQTFNNYSGDLKLSSVNFSYFVVAFSGSQEAKGEVVFEISPIDDNLGDIYKVVFIPDSPSLFPFIASGFYAKALIKIDLLNHLKVKELLFTTKEWEDAISKGLPYISKRVEINISNYATSVECDSRQYYAEILSVKSKTELVKNSEKRTELIGC